MIVGYAINQIMSATSAHWCLQRLRQWKRWGRHVGSWGRRLPFEKCPSSCCRWSWWDVTCRFLLHHALLPRVASACGGAGVARQVERRQPSWQSWQQWRALPFASCPTALLLQPERKRHWKMQNSDKNVMIFWMLSSTNIVFLEEIIKKNAQYLWFWRAKV